jgi:hypothetical protein
MQGGARLLGCGRSTTPYFSLDLHPLGCVASRGVLAPHYDTYLALCYWQLWKHRHEVVFRQQVPFVPHLLNTCVQTVKNQIYNTFDYKNEQLSPITLIEQKAHWGP